MYRLFTKKALCMLVFIIASMHLPNVVYSQWSNTIPITVTNNENQTVNGWQLPIYVNTATLVSNGMMHAAGNDIRFCDGTNYLPYYIDSGMNTTKTKIWVKMDMQASDVSIIYMLFNNSTATPASTLSALNGPFSSTNQISGGTSGGVVNSQRGFRFTPKRNILVSSFGKNEPNGTTRFVTLFDWNTQAVLEQQQVSGSASVYSYQQLPSPRWLTDNNIYTIQLYQNSTDGYYYQNSSQINNALTYHDMRFCNGCTQNTFPTDVLTNLHYGYPDFEFYTVDTNNITNTPTYTVGSLSTVASTNITQHPVADTTCEGGVAIFKMVYTGGAANFQWQQSTDSTTWTNITNGGIYSSATTPALIINGITPNMHGYQYRCQIFNATCLSSVTNAATLIIGPPPSVTSTTNAVACTNGPAELRASASKGGIRWYDSASGGTLLNTGSTFRIPNLTNDTSLYAEAYTGIADSLLANVGGTGGNEGAVFEIVPKQNITLTDVTWTAGSTGLYDIRVYIKTGGYTTSMANASAWTLIGSNSSFTGTNNVAYKLNLSSPQTLVQGQTYSIYVVNADAGLRNVTYQSTGSNTMGNVYSEDDALQIKVGSRIAVSNANPFDNGVANNYAFTGTLWYELTNCTSARTQVMATVATPPTITATHGDSICIGNYATAVATPSTGNITQWYNLNSGGIPIAYGDTLHTPILYTTRDYYTQAVTYLPDSLLTRTTSGLTSRGFSFDIQPQKHLRLTDITWVPAHTGAYDMKVYITWGGISGKMTNQGMWDLVGDFSNHAATSGVPNKLHLPNPQYLDAGQVYGIYIVNTHVSDRHLSFAASSTTTGTVVAQDGNLQVKAGFGVGTGQMPFINAITIDREFTGTVWYDTVGCSSATRTPVTVYVDQQPTVTADPQNDTICAGGNTIFTIGSYGTDLKYQWQVHNGTAWANVSGGIYNGENTDTLTLTNATNGINNYQYRCIIGNTQCSPDTSAAATLTIDLPANITTQPAATRTICVGGSTTYSVAATGSGLTYEWQVYNGTTWSNATGGVYSGGNTSTLTINMATTAQDGHVYRCIVGNASCNTDTSNTGALTVNTAPAITTDPLAHAICTGSNTTFSVAATGTNLSYQWQVHNGTTWANATGGIYTGATTNTLTLTNATTAVDNYQYRCVVSNTGCTAATSAAATLTIDVPANITTQPVATRTICVGQNTTLSIAAAGSNLSYQWEMYDGTTWNNVAGPVYSGANTNTLTITAATAAQYGQYRCVVSNTGCAAVTSNTSDLTVNTPPAITTEPQTSRIICEGGTTTFNIVATGTNLVYNWETNNGTSTWSTVSGAMYSGVNTNTLSITAPTFAMNGHLYRCVVTNTGCALKVSKIGTLIVQEPPMVTTQPSTTRVICAGNNTTFSVAATGTLISYQWEVFNGTTWSNATGGVYTGDNTNTLSITNATAALNGYQYRCAISSPTCATINSNTGTLTIETAPAITTDPVSRIVCDGGSTTFSIVATGSNLSYQWEASGNGTVWIPLTNGASHTGVNAATLTLPNVTSGVVYRYYRCVINGSCPPAITSNAAQLEIRFAPAVTTQPVNSDVCVGKNTRFTVLATGSLLTYKWQVSTNGGTNWNFLSEAGMYSGTSTSVLNITNVPLSANNYKYRCIVSGYCPAPITTDAVTMTVNTYVVITSQPIKADTICSGGNINLSVGATGSGLTYEWYLNKGNGDPIVQLTDDATYSGTTTANLTGTGISVTEKTYTYSYSCIVRGTCSSERADLSNITIYAAPAVKQHPVSVDRCDKTHRVLFTIKADGSNITYQWQESTDGGNTWAALANGTNYSNVTTNAMEILTADLTMNNYMYRCVVTGICGSPATSNGAKLTVNPLLEPEVSITANNTDFCAGTSVTFTPTPTNGGSSPTYQWRINSVNVATGATFTTSTLANNDFVSCVMTSNAVCKTKTTVGSNYVYVKVTPRTNASVSITSNVGTSWCSGKDAIFTATPVNGGNAPIYEWTVNGIPTGVTTRQFTTMLNNGDEVQCMMTSSIRCATPAIAASNKIKMTINVTTAASILISPNPDSVICSEDEVLMYVAFTNGGSVPKFQWMVNGVDLQGETNATLRTTQLEQDDIVNCRLISSNICVFPEVSNGISFDVNTRLKPEVRLQSSFMGNNTYTFTATAVNEGANPSYIWFRNGTLQAGLTGPVQTFENLSTVERIHVQLVSSEACIVKGLESVTSNVIATTSAATTEKLFNAITLHPNPGSGDFTINGNLNTKLLNKEVLIRVSNSVGQTVYQQQYYIKDNNIHLPISLGSQLVGGVYMVTLIADNDIYSMKYVLSR